MIPLRIRPHVVALAALAMSGLAPGAALAAESGGEQAFDIHSGQALTFAAKVEGGKVIVGRPRISRLGAAHPAAGEMSVELTPRDNDMYEQVIVTEKTAQPIDFVATALVGDVKIDERVLCGRLDGEASSRIGANHWRVRLHDFEVGKGDGSCD
jgi:hypothetical protein